MTDYYSPMVIPEIIPNADMTPLEVLLLSQIFETDSDRDGTYFYSRHGPSDIICVNASAIRAALGAADERASQVRDYVVEKIKKSAAQESRAAQEDQAYQEDIELDMSGTSWEFILQDIVRRSSTLSHVTVTTAFTCSKMRPDGFGGMALFITAAAIKGCSTSEFLSDYLAGDA